MQLGLSVTTAHPFSVDAATAAHWTVERAAAAAGAGFASFSVGDHHNTPSHYLQNVPMLARCLAEVGEMTVLPLFLVPLWHPVLLAEQVGTLAALAKGELHCIFAIGAGEEQFHALGVSEDERRGRIEEALRLLRRLFSEDDVDHEGDYWLLSGVNVNPKPRVAPQFWIGASAPVAIDRAARLGDAWLVAPGETPASAAEKLALYKQGLERAGTLSSTKTFPIRRDVYVGESDAEALETTAPLTKNGYRGFDPEALIIGGPDTVAAKLRELEGLGFNHTLIRFLPVGQDVVLRSIDRIGREVIPALR